MACTSCLPKLNGVCKVCELIDKDVTVKIVKKCRTCGVYICNDCNFNLVKRWKAYKEHKKNKEL